MLTKPSRTHTDAQPKTMTCNAGRGLGVIVMTAGDLPLPGTFKRWNRWRKAMFVKAVIEGLKTLEAFLEEYQVGREEFDRWKAAYEQGGIEALRCPPVHRKRTQVIQVEQAA